MPKNYSFLSRVRNKLLLAVAAIAVPEKRIYIWDSLHLDKKKKPYSYISYK